MLIIKKVFKLFLIVICFIELFSVSVCYAAPKDSIVQRKFIHEIHILLKKKKSDPFNSEEDTSGLKLEVFQPKNKFKLKYEVFGWYPYWEKDYYKYINYSLLSTVTYVSYEVNPQTGAAKTVHDWDKSPMIDSAKAHGTKVLLGVTNFGIDKNHKFLANKKAVNKLIKNLLQLLAKRDANGVCIDFEGVQEKDKDLFTSFIKNLNKAFKAKGYEIYLAVPNVDLDKSLDFSKLVNLINRFVIMGYPYFSPSSNIAGPLAPIKSDKLWESYNLTNSIKYYLSNDVADTSLILALPFYGIVWDTKSKDLGADVEKFIGFRTYSYIKKSLKDIKYDHVSKSAYSSYHTSKEDKTIQIRQCWFENDSSIAAKLNLIKKYKLAGMGIWALGFDKGYNDLWKVISVEFDSSNTSKNGNSDTQNDSIQKNDSAQTNSAHIVVATSDSTHHSSSVTKPSVLSEVELKLKSVTNYRSILLYVMVLISICGVVGFLIGMLSANTRAYFFTNNAMRWYYIGVVLLFTVVSLRIFNIINNTSIVLGLGFIIGSGSYHLATKIIEHKNKNIP
jgi:chitinase